MEDQNTLQSPQTAPQPQQTAPPDMTFDSAPLTAQSAPQATGADMTFDAAPLSVRNTSQPQAPVPDSLHIQDGMGINPDDGPLTRLGKGALDFAKRTNAVGAGIGDGLLDTINGTADFLHLPHALLAQRQKELEQQNSENPALNTTGKIADNVAEFISGDELLKGMAWSDRLLKTAKIAKVLESSPRLAKAVEIGVNALRSGFVQGGDTFLKTGGDAKQGVEQGLLAGGLTGALGVGGQTVKTIRAALDDSGLQPALQDGIRKILADAADKAGVSAPMAQSIRDAAQQVSDGVRAKASSLYQTLDNISGGQAQRFRDALDNVASKLREIRGLDDDKEAALLVRQAEIEQAHKAMLAELQKAGHDPNMLAQADAAWKQQAALSDLSNSIRQATTGLRPELANGAKGATTPEAVNAKTLFTKINRLNDRGRLAQAIGQDNADALLQHVDAAYVQAQKIAARQKWAGTVAKAAGISGLAAEAVHGLHSLFGGNQ